MSPYTITATKSPVVFGASPLPPGLSIDQITGVISGSAAIPLTAPGASGYANSSTKQNVRFNDTSDIVTTSNGTYITDRNNYVVRKYVNEASGATVFAGSPGNSGTQDGTGGAARFTDLKSITVDSSGNIYVLDGCAVRKITSAGVVTTFAGSVLVSGFVNAVGTAARFSDPFSIRIVGAVIVVADRVDTQLGNSGNGYLRAINISTSSVSTLLLLNGNLLVNNGSAVSASNDHAICGQIGVGSSSVYFGYRVKAFTGATSFVGWGGVAKYSFSSGTVTQYYLNAYNTFFANLHGSPIFLGNQPETNGVCKMASASGGVGLPQRIVSFTGNGVNISDGFISGLDLYYPRAQGMFCYNGSEDFYSADNNCLTSFSNSSGSWVRTLVSGSLGQYPATSTNSTLSANNGALSGTATLNIQTSQAYP